jgi:hypothetical protein
MRRLHTSLILLAALLLTLPATAEVLRNDGWEDGHALSFQGGFVAGETGAVRLVPTVPGTWPLQNVQLMFGGAVSLEDVVLTIWDDSAGTDIPGAVIYSETYSLLGADDFMNEIDLSGEGLSVSGPIRVGIEFTHGGYPSIARDDDGSINAARNFILTGGTWYRSNLFGLTGDWIIRANTNSANTFTVGGSVTGLSGSLTLQNNGGDDLVITSNGSFTFATALNDSDPYAVTVLSEPAGQICVVSNGSGTISGADVTDVLVTCSGGGTSTATLQNDSFVDGGTAVFQGGFTLGEIAAARLTTPNPDPWTLDSVELLFGGAATLQTVTLKIWDDSAGTVEPGTELYSDDYVLLGGDFLQQIDLTAAGLSVSGDFRVGIQFQHAGYPSVARDDDGITADRNFIYISGGPWYEAGALAVTGDWIIRATVSQEQEPTPFDITSITDFPNDQGRQVRITWPNNQHDAPGDPTPVTGYAIFRRIDPDLKAYPPGDWDYLSTVPAFQETSYATIVPTAADSTIVDGMYYSTFFVRAMTTSPGVYFDSAPDSGYSVDNLVPQTPQGFAVAYNAVTGNALAWNESPDADFAYFKIYRGDTPDFTIDTGSPHHTTTSVDWIDSGGGFGHHYRISTADFSGNESPATDASSTELTGAELPRAATLSPVYPNPFNPSTTIRFELPAEGRARVSVYDAYGRLVRTLVDRPLPGGSHEVQWDGRDDHGRGAPAGVYLCRLEVGAHHQARSVTLVK